MSYLESNSSNKDTELNAIYVWGVCVCVFVVLGVEQLQCRHRAERRPLVKKGVDLRHTAPVPAGGASKHFGQRALQPPAVVPLVPQQLPIRSGQPARWESISGSSQQRSTVTCRSLLLSTFGHLYAIMGVTEDEPAWYYCIIFHATSTAEYSKSSKFIQSFTS